MNFLHLLRVDLLKMKNYRTFWVVCGLYFLTLAFSTASGMEFLKWLATLIEGFGESLNINRIPLYHFPDVWLNLIWFSGLFKIVLAMMTIISITNEFTYRTLRQNIIDGLSRGEFLVSKVLTNFTLSLASMVLIAVIAFITGLIYSPYIEWTYVITDMEFVFAYFLEVFAFLSYALLLGILIQRSGLTIIVLLLSHVLELIIRENIDEYVPWLIPFFPMESISNLVPLPYARYALQEIRDYLTWDSVAIVLGWIGVFHALAYWKLKRSDI